MKAKAIAVSVWLGFLLSGISLLQTADASELSITAGPSAYVMGSSVTIRWSLTSVATGQVQYGTTTGYGQASTPELSYKFSTHIQTITGLAPGTTYHYRVVSANVNGARVASPDSTFTTASLTSSGSSPTSSGLNITAGPTVSGLTTSSAAIQWSLNSVATGQVQYGTTTGYGQASAPELSYKFSTHIQTITGLAPGTTYHYRVVSTNANGVQVVSPDSTFTTASLTSTGGTTGEMACP